MVCLPAGNGSYLLAGADILTYFLGTAEMVSHRHIVADRGTQRKCHDYGQNKDLILPAFTLSVFGISNVTLHTREKMIDVLNSEYVTFAKARGENVWQIFKNHAVRNAIVPAITIHFSYFGELFGGSVLAEQVFSYPGLGSTLTEAGLKSDTPLLLAIVIIGAVFVFFGNMTADILNGIFNPNLRRNE